ncbi:DUF732 domain-containing protein [Mycobacterium paraterrae]|uniref:DUF732 domain-containing protein n=1 Tax=Mycobacterium paraterrae TaxID=577492 RepID=A0ABY3VRT0_9MYCO|nr:DUF732 domain-containing protein [Mycobacterium paraterrae]UMB71860.1 DUF732 domain-containing protein [Mycobacterium paraterrae]
MRRRLLMLLSAPVMIALAATAQADPSSAPNDDVDFLKQMTDAGLSYHDPKQAVTVAKSVCDLADKGTSQADIEKDLMTSNPSFTSGGVRKFVILSAGEYCPKYLPTEYRPKPPAEGDSPKPPSP